MNIPNSNMRTLRISSTEDKVELCISPSRTKLHKIRCNLICVVAIAAYFATVFGAGNNIVYLCLAVSALALAWPAVNAHRGLRWTLFALLTAVLWGSIFNGVVASLRSVTPYLVLLVAFALLAHVPAANARNRANDIALLYGAGLLQLGTYVVLSVASPYYSFLYSLDVFNRFSVGFISVICFFHVSLPARMKPDLPRNLRYLGLIFWLVPVLVILNSSRSELLMTATLAIISLYMRWRLLFVGSLVGVVMALTLIAQNIIAAEPIRRSFEEVFTTDVETSSEAYANYRAFENWMMIDRIAASGPLGCGLGCEVPFPMTIVLNEKDYEEVTVFHNGYLTVLLHFGLAGAVLIMVLARQLLRAWRAFSQAYRSRKNFDGATLQAEALRLSVLVLMLGTGLTTGGFMSPLDTLVLLLPLCSAVGVMRTRLY